MSNLSHEIARNTIAEILSRHGIEPAQGTFSGRIGLVAGPEARLAVRPVDLMGTAAMSKN